jgi:hypothetical protein
MVLFGAVQYVKKPISSHAYVGLLELMSVFNCFTRNRNQVSAASLADVYITESNIKRRYTMTVNPVVVGVDGFAAKASIQSLVRLGPKPCWNPETGRDVFAKSLGLQTGARREKAK